MAKKTYFLSDYKFPDIDFKVIFPFPKYDGDSDIADAIALSFQLLKGTQVKPMTEQEWLASAAPAVMLRFVCTHPSGLSGKARMVPLSDRKLCMLARASVELGQTDLSDVPEECTPGGMEPLTWVENCIKGLPGGPTRSIMANLLRDVFGNVWRPQETPWVINKQTGNDITPTYRTWHPRVKEWMQWNDSTIPKLAQAIYDTRDFDLMPILADALEGAGCNDAAILEHCRGQEPCPRGCGRLRHGKPCQLCGDIYRITLRGPHVRGCWVIDLLLGKE